MSLESLANELLLDLFEYLDTVNLLRAFHSLNDRFDQLLFIKLQRYHLDFRSILKRDFEIFCQQHLSLINYRIISLHLSDDVETPNLPQIFLSYGYRINQFIHLKSLSIDNIYSFDLLNQITSQYRDLSYLTHLSITINNNQDPEENFRDFINNIWSLSKLTHCYLDIMYSYTTWLLEMSVNSQSIIYLSTKNICYNSHSLYHLLKHTPHLQRLHIGNIGQFNDQQIQTIFPSLISMNLIVQCSLEWMTNLFQKIPNLCYLTVEINGNNLDGYLWEKILIDHFKNIKIFRLKMTVEFYASNDVEEQVDQLLDSFRSHYWIEKHRWFVQCDWYLMDINKTGLLYTLPYAFDSFYYTDGSRSKSTNPNDLDYLSYNQVQTLYHAQRKRDLCVNCTLFPARFLNIRHLKLKFPLNDNFWSMTPTLDRLISLDATLNHDLGYSQLQILLDRAPHLYSLSFRHSNNFSMTSFNISSTSVRRLEFFQTFEFHFPYFNNTECSILAGTSLASQCEILMINVERRISILQFINTMPNLRVLTVCCKDDKKNQYHYESLQTNDEFIEWLNEHLPSKYTYSINRNLFKIYYINLWIHKAL